ncbi:MAG: YveK family protein [Clostridium sp.]
MNEEIIKIEDIANVLIKRWKVIISITIISTIISAVISFFAIDPKYQANTKLFIGKESNTVQDQSYSNNDVQMYQKLLKTYAEIITTNDLVGRAIKESNIDIESKDILSNLTVNPRADTQILEISYTNVDKEAAREIVELITAEFIEYSIELIPNGNVRIIEEVKTPVNPVSPNKKMNILIGFALGLMASIGLCFLIEFMDDTFRTKEEIEQIMSVPAIGIIPDEYLFE